MPNFNVLTGPYGKYIKCGNNNISMLSPKVDDKFDWHARGYLTDALIEKMLDGHEVSFNVTYSDSLSGPVHAKIVPTFDIHKKQRYRVEFTDAILDNEKHLITTNAVQLVTAYVQANYNYRAVQAKLDDLHLLYNWKIFIQDIPGGARQLCELIVYTYQARKQELQFYGYIDDKTNEIRIVDAIEVEKIKAVISQRIAEETQEFANQQKMLNAAYDELQAFKNKLSLDVRNSSDPISYVLQQTQSYNFTTMARYTDAVSMFVQRYHGGATLRHLENCIRTGASRLHYDQRTKESLEQAVLDAKKSLLFELAVWAGAAKLNQLRLSLLKSYNDSSLIAEFDNLDDDEVFDYGRFSVFRKCFTSANAPEAITQNMYLDCVDADELKHKLIVALAAYYNFTVMPAKTRKKTAEFIAKYDLAEYYERISQYEDTWTTLLDTSKNVAFKKRLLGEVVNHRCGTALKTSTYYFEKLAIVHSTSGNTSKILSELWDILPTFNVSSDVAVLVNIELESIDTVKFAFYSFDASYSGKGDIDGRRLSNLTRLYNAKYSDEIHINFI